MFPTKSGNVRAHLAQFNFNIAIKIEINFCAYLTKCKYLLNFILKDHKFKGRGLRKNAFFGFHANEEIGSWSILRKWATERFSMSFIKH